MHISVIIPTYNEAENIKGLLPKLIDILDKLRIKFQILVVDDASLDNTPGIVDAILGQNGRVIRRGQGERSLSLSVMEGINQSEGDTIVVMDGDGSHPPELLPQFIKTIGNGCDLVIGSRYVLGGGTKNFPFFRKIISRSACLIGRLVTEVRDNSSGFICVRKSFLDDIKFNSRGFKIGLEIFVKGGFKRFKEVPYVFINREKGESKLNIKIAFEYFCQIANLLKYKFGNQR